ncbi:hypothetical protein BDE02_01G105900 [Populus trichocarpa]|nr:hypothetical protein BDE02_01G105900 [Populus trichocarpa]
MRKGLASGIRMPSHTVSHGFLLIFVLIPKQVILDSLQETNHSLNGQNLSLHQNQEHQIIHQRHHSGSLNFCALNLFFSASSSSKSEFSLNFCWLLSSSLISSISARENIFFSCSLQKRSQMGSCRLWLGTAPLVLRNASIEIVI